MANSIDFYKLFSILFFFLSPTKYILLLATDSDIYPIILYFSNILFCKTNKLFRQIQMLIVKDLNFIGSLALQWQNV